MKAFLRLFYIAIVAIVVFTGALMIARGMRGEEKATASVAPAVREIPLDDENNSAA